MADRSTSTKRPRKPADRERNTARTATTGNPGKDPGKNPGKNQDLVSQVVWDIASINVHIDEIRQFWAKEIGISGPQWMILMAIGDLDRGNGVSVKEVSAMLHVDPSFVTTQSKMLEKNGFIRRVPSTEDARVVLMSLSDKAGKKLAVLSSRRDNLTAFVFSGYDEAALRDISDQLSALKSRLEKATLMLSIVG
ncbi:winged helix-turn-helix transcriptional regulator [Tardiphaga sp. vice352]|uniref:MarR family winged helix-turn-helix transcriptional regulator n=1 Tax=unclassified Tardiphaga TaxID=2631404 RepID=UPI00116579BB|nr:MULTISPECIES: MarR family winged helix-turn-helix transcriptional regulator [unclassified Tardiphaga]MBC7584137.1 winged helix-turn-helix transcriptional regulator [Tardiphaga sp.]QDM18805.1 winged helix-turn-helix transcriptional regulator [Tardiphaga sp. vice278]QDM23798.1 winged helix-turn-helix transcriptional regulator [Tardiphaga sp. vice154]QDM29021.1 winged helix-turn-helix transcriptional regulator [Tardiphaga sp. vice304]QDM34121.1 winged helix-turn-helix transcriptional regulator